MDATLFFNAAAAAAHLSAAPPISARAHFSEPPRGRSVSVVKSSASSAPEMVSSSAAPRRFRWLGGERRDDESTPEGEELEKTHLQSEKERENWVLKILHLRSIWSGQMKKPEEEEEEGIDQSRCSCGDEEESDGCRVGDDDDHGVGEMGLDRESFSRLLHRVSLVEAKVYAQMSYLCSLAYSIPEIKPRNLLKYRGYRFITSSLEKKAEFVNAEKEQMSSSEKKAQSVATEKEQLSLQEREKEMGEAKKVEKHANDGHRISASAAYQIAASAASYLQSHTKSILSFKSSRTNMEDDFLEGGGNNIKETKITSSEVASLMATTNSVTAVVAGKEEMKQAVAKDLRSLHSSPCEWFICDDESYGTRFLVIQGSESLASWQANLLFEPIQFEGLDVLVHRGIYEAAKGIYEQILPEVRAHLKSRGNSATFRFTGHSLGGSLSLLLNLMLLIRSEVPISSLLPVITFGSPSIMCGGDRLFHELGLPESHVQAIMMHRDIVPRAFSCSYPDHIAQILKAVNGNFRNHPCLRNQKLLYASVGKLLILQPEEKFSPYHDLLPADSGLYLLGHPVSDSGDLIKQIHAAKAMFLNSPHPIEILRDLFAYGSDGAITQNHDMNSYLRSICSVLSQELKHIRKVKREQRRKVWWPLVAHQGLPNSVIMDQSDEIVNMGLRQLIFSGVFLERKRVMEAVQ
ncbi:Lipase, class 3 [Cinnamomum micranthum f. kanehirae]|uniref:Lipase, class 3 n=1 Tax=Cinnamomum micranthum f. kanehirae TaxID=337451 RepID=A0A3S3N8Q2_9MAGN|nr:Lipase, class 3 [Cinnamomum micranthum f. kanehirae]